MNILIIHILEVIIGISYGCSKERFNESVFEGLKKREEIKRSPNKPSQMDKSMSYDEYLIEKERTQE